jgi:hypothetical protein
MTAPEKPRSKDSGALYPLYNISEDIVWLPDMKEPDFLLDPEIRPRVTGRGALEIFLEQESSDDEIREILTAKSRELGSNYIIDVRKHRPGRFPVLSFWSLKHSKAALRITAILILAARENGFTDSAETHDMNDYYITSRSCDTAHFLKRLPPPREDKAGLILSVLAGAVLLIAFFISTGILFMK